MKSNKIEISKWWITIFLLYMLICGGVMVAVGLKYKGFKNTCDQCIEEGYCNDPNIHFIPRVNREEIEDVNELNLSITDSVINGDKNE